MTLAVEDAYVDIQGSVSDWLVTTDSLVIANQVRQQLHNSFCGFWSTRILLYFPLSSVRPSVMGVTSKLSC